MLDNMIKEYIDIQKQEEEIKAKKEQLGLQIKEALANEPDATYITAEGNRAMMVEKTTFKYTDELAIMNYIKTKGLSDVYLTTKIDTTKFNKELKSEGMLFEAVKSFVTKTITEALTVKEGE